MVTVRIVKETLEGDPAEIAEYVRLTEGAAVDGDASMAKATEAPAEADIEDVEEVEPTDEIEVGGGELNEQDHAWLKRFVWSRGKGDQRTQLVEDFVLQSLSIDGVLVESGTSSRTANGESTYLMVRDAGPRRFGAVTYVQPGAARLNFRLHAEDVEDVKDRVVLRNIVKGQHHYRVNLELHTPEDVQLGLELSKRALAKVRL